MKQLPLARVLAELSSSTGVTFDQARTMPASIYNSEELQEHEVERLFSREWICVGRGAEILNPGDYLTFDIVNHPVLVVRQDDASVQAFSNVCVHRSAKLVDGCGSARRFVCPYHAWTYALDGRLTATRFMQETPEFRNDEHRLQRLKTEIWQGFIYVTLNESATPVAQRLSGLASVIGSYQIANYRHAFSVDEIWPANWKCFVENFMDAYHLFKVHAETFGKSGHYEDLTRMHDGEEHYTYHLVDGHETDPSGAAHPANDWLDATLRRTTVLACVFPSHTIQLQPDMLWYVTVQPAGTDHFRMRWSVSVPEEILASLSDPQSHIEELREFLSAVNAEDHSVVQRVFMGLRSGANVAGPMSWLERNVYRFDQYLARQLND